MATFFGAIADDLTGATDLAGLVARSGVSVSLRMGLPSSPPIDTATVEIIALKCRTAPVATAVAETRAALAWLRSAGAERFYWKYCSTFDSTAEGNIGPVAEALMRDLGVTQTLYCPAFPENGRSIYMGNLFVGEKLLAESPMKDHPLTPMRDSNLMRLLAPQVTAPVGLANRRDVARGVPGLRARMRALAEQGVAHVVVDAVCNDDLAIIATAGQDMPLLTGGSALAAPLPTLWAEAGLLTRVLSGQGSKPVAPAAIVLSGSCSDMTNRQVACYLADGHPSFRLDPLSLAQQGSGPVLDWLAGQPLTSSPLIYATALPDSVHRTQELLGRGQAGEIIESTLAACALAARDRGVRRFVIAGGETSGSVVQGLGISQLDVGAEITPGVPWCRAKSGGHDLAITLKSGNFGSEEFFAAALASLQ